MASKLTEEVLARVKKRSSAPKTGNKHKFSGRNNKPARQRYWASGRLEKKKIRNLVRYCGMTEAQAYVHWHATRNGRIRK